jgi:hypothetical protein
VRERLRRVLQILRDMNRVEFVDNHGTYRMASPGRRKLHDLFSSVCRLLRQKHRHNYLQLDRSSRPATWGTTPL